MTMVWGDPAGFASEGWSLITGSKITAPASLMFLPS